MPRGGKRQGTPGKGYSNRTDLAVDPNMGQNTAASGGMTAPAQAAAIPQARFVPPPVGADQVPNIGDPTDMQEPITAGLPMGPGPGPEAVGPLPPPPTDPVREAVQALMLVSPNPDLIRVLNRLDFEGR